MFESVVCLLGQLFLEAPHLLLAQRIDSVAILARHVEAVDNDRRVGKHLLDGGTVAFPHVGADGGDARGYAPWYALEPVHHRGLLSIGQDCQQMQIATFGLGTDDSNKVAMALE